MPGLVLIHDAIDRVHTTLDEELPQIRAAIQAGQDGPTPEEVDVVVNRLDALKVKIADIVP